MKNICKILLVPIHEKGDKRVYTYSNCSISQAGILVNKKLADINDLKKSCRSKNLLKKDSVTGLYHGEKRTERYFKICSKMVITC